MLLIEKIFITCFILAFPGAGVAGIGASIDNDVLVAIGLAPTVSFICIFIYVLLKAIWLTA